jgi:hypothetical protein
MENQQFESTHVQAAGLVHDASQHTAEPAVGGMAFAADTQTDAAEPLQTQHQPAEIVPAVSEPGVSGSVPTTHPAPSIIPLPNILSIEQVEQSMRQRRLVKNAVVGGFMGALVLGLLGFVLFRADVTEATVAEAPAAPAPMVSAPVTITPPEVKTAPAAPSGRGTTSIVDDEGNKVVIDRSRGTVTITPSKGSLK